LEKKKKDKEPMDAIEAELDKPTERIKDDSRPSYIKQKGDDGEDTVEDEEDEEIEGDIIKVDPKFVKQSSELYKKFLEGQ
jgi:hypothetical protein